MTFNAFLQLFAVSVIVSWLGVAPAVYAAVYFASRKARKDGDNK